MSPETAATAASTRTAQLEQALRKVIRGKDDVIDLIFAQYGGEHAAIVGGFSTSPLFNNRQLFNTNNQVAWVADVPGSKDKYLAVFNTSPPPPPARDRRGAPPAVELADNSAIATNKPPATPPTKEPVSISVSLTDLGISNLDIMAVHTE